MKRVAITKADLKAKSDARKMPFSVLLAGWVLEEIVALLADSGFADYLWLKNGSELGIEQYGKKNILDLNYVYLNDERVVKKGSLEPGQKLSVKVAILILAQIVQKEKVPEIKWRGNFSLNQELLTLDIVAEFEEMKVPVQVKIREIGVPPVLPVKKKLVPFLDGGREISYMQYPADMLLSEQLFAIVRDMELIPEMEAYDTVYQILSWEPLDGRHIRELLGELCQKNGLVPGEDRAGTILSYRDYTYMRKRWARYLRQQKKKSPSWDDVMELLGEFLPGVWNAISRDEVFFGDWMPDLGRFLE